MFKLSIGLNDKVTKTQVITTEAAIMEVVNHMKELKTGFTLLTASGGYLHDDGSYVAENSLRLELFDVDRAGAADIAKYFASVFNQESIALEEVIANVDFITA